MSSEIDVELDMDIELNGSNSILTYCETCYGELRDSQECFQCKQSRWRYRWRQTSLTALTGICLLEVLQPAWQASMTTLTVVGCLILVTSRFRSG